MTPSNEASKHLPDIQQLPDTRNKDINWAGIRDYKIPFSVQTRDGGKVSTVGTIKIMTDLPKESKGVNMSRFSAVIEKALEKNLMSTDLLVDMVTACRDVLENKNSYVIINFDYFIKKKAPVTRHESHFVVPCNFCGVLENGEIKIYLESHVQYMSLCPCSKEMSAGEKLQNAHNQRSTAVVRVKFKDLQNYVWIEDLVEMVEASASCPIWNYLKRADEKYVTEKSYENPKFVEDVVRDLAIKLDERPEVEGYRIEVAHHESIHQHDAFARISHNL